MIRAFGLLCLVACGDDGSTCRRDGDCPAFHRCIAETCRPLAPSDAGGRDAGPPRDGAMTRSDAGSGPGPGDAGGAADARVPDACDNAADGMAFARRYGAMMLTLGETLNGCITTCFGGVDRVNCFDDCAFEMVGDALTAPCRLCIAEFMDCGVEQCATACFPAMDMDCGRCLCNGAGMSMEPSCEQGFRTCGGAPSPFEYADVGYMCPM